jgi:hypothetical protein
MSEFKDLYEKANTYKNIALTITTLTDNEIIEMAVGMKLVDNTSGLDKKQEALLKALHYHINNRSRDDGLA